jgi:ubiquinone/menaquinone biosynthesis C-methylase UbiE
MNDLTKSIRESYDRLAEQYALRIFDELEHKPLDRELLSRFAEETRGGTVCDLGCGPGHVARYLHDKKANVFGLDVSPKMLDQARKLNSGIAFQVGDMLALHLEDSSLAGITAFYAIVNLPPAMLAIAFTEMARVLQPGGLLLLAFHAGNETLHEDELWGEPVSMDFYLLDPAMVRSQLTAAGLKVEEVILREPYAPEVEYQSRRAYMFARKPK